VPVRQRSGAFLEHAWDVLRTMPAGAPVSYTEYAAKSGRPAAVRAAASACARNATALFVPCHRVLRNDGSLGGFRWGLPVKRWLLVMSLAVTPTIVLRWWELWAINTRWDTTAYGSAAWTIVGFHTSLLLLDVVDTIGLTLFYFVRKMPARTFSDTVDNSTYWYFTVSLWIAIYLIVYVGPRVI